ncbi:uncharacterized protein LOC134275389 [Saccostrea cucullata]|uniref:uncharacterized protein LOC134275389 n=1 Tax=Saccostrea cuccullata TaxID=36930 RepID=UPI002ED50FD5
MADTQIPVSGELLKPRCDVHCRDLLPLFCRSCDQPICSDCVTLGQHAGHQLCEISEVVQLHQSELQEVLKTEKTTPFLRKILADSKEKQKCLAVHTENLLRSVINRKEEICEMVRQWREKMVGRVMTFRDTYENSLRKEQSLIHALLHLKEGFQFDSEERKLEITYLNCKTKRFLSDKAYLSDVGSTCHFEKGTLNGDSTDVFGNISEVETSSDAISLSQNEENEQKEELVEEEEKFHDCIELPRTYQAGEASIQGIIPIDSTSVVLQISNTVCRCNIEGEKFCKSTILECVHQIAHIPASGDILAIMEDQKEIRRISTLKSKVITKFINTDQTKDYFCCLTAGGKEAYACVVIHSSYINSIASHVNLLNDDGVILKKIETSTSYCIRIMYYDGFFLLISSGSHPQVERIDLIRQSPMIRYYKKYRGSVGSSPELRFRPTDLTLDSQNNVLVAVYNDNAIYLLDKSLTFQKLLMTEEDGLRQPTAIAIDTIGYLWVGCENGQTHRINYQYLLSTNLSKQSHLLDV